MITFKHLPDIRIPWLSEKHLESTIERYCLSYSMNTHAIDDWFQAGSSLALDLLPPETPPLDAGRCIPPITRKQCLFNPQSQVTDRSNQLTRPLVFTQATLPFNLAAYAFDIIQRLAHLDERIA